MDCTAQQMEQLHSFFLGFEAEMVVTDFNDGDVLLHDGSLVSVEGLKVCTFSLECFQLIPHLMFDGFGVLRNVFHVAVLWPVVADVTDKNCNTGRAKGFHTVCS
jgi:hypothetical protein